MIVRLLEAWPEVQHFLLGVGRRRPRRGKCYARQGRLPYQSGFPAGLLIECHFAQPQMDWENLFTFDIPPKTIRNRFRENDLACKFGQG